MRYYDDIYGGSWGMDALFSMTCYKYLYNYSYRNINVGFRIFKYHKYG